MRGEDLQHGSHVGREHWLSAARKNKTDTESDDSLDVISGIRTALYDEDGRLRRFIAPGLIDCLLKARYHGFFYINAAGPELRPKYPPFFVNSIRNLFCCRFIPIAAHSCFCL